MSIFRFGCGHVKLDEDVHEASWGARLIYNEVIAGSSGVVWDRQTPEGESREAIEALFPVVDRAMDEFRKVQFELPWDSRGRFAWREDDILVVMSPQGSYGYLYITAVLERQDRVGQTRLAEFESDPVAEFGNWPPEVVEARKAREREFAVRRIEYLERDLKWAQDEVRYARTDRARTIRQKKADAIEAELVALREEVG